MHNCRICGKQIIDDEAQFGPDCAERYREVLATIETNPTEVGDLFLTGDPTVQTWLRRMTSALIQALKTSGGRRMKHLTFAKEAIRCAREFAKSDLIELEEAA